MEPLLTSREMKAADTYTIEKLKVPAPELMQRAARVVVEALERHFGKAFSKTKGIILAGKGNNGGDARLVFEMLKSRGIPSEVNPSSFSICDWVVDGLFGTGLTRAVEGKEKETIETLNQLKPRPWVVSIDIPSGLSSDTGRVLGSAVKADVTVTLGFYKRGLVTGEAANFVGEIHLDSIGIPRKCGENATTFLYTKEDALEIPQRPKASHKGKFGHVYVLAGEEEKEGAAVLSALGALRSGSGLVTVIGNKEIRHRLPVECMIEEFSDKFFKKIDPSTFVVGPGMGVNEKSWVKLQNFLKSPNALVLDADALTLISQNEREAQKLIEIRGGQGALTVLTPHPKEAARLLGQEVSQVELNRYDSIEKLAERWRGWIVLKGSGTLIKEGRNPTFVVQQGDSGLSKGGTGDLLTGILASLLGQGLPSNQAIPFGVYCHGKASELITARFGTARSTLASDIALVLPDVFKELSK